MYMGREKSAEIDWRLPYSKSNTFSIFQEEISEDTLGKLD